MGLDRKEVLCGARQEKERIELEHYSIFEHAVVQDMQEKRIGDLLLHELGKWQRGEV